MAKKGRPQRFDLSKDYPDNKDALGEETALYEDDSKHGDVSRFHEYDPQRIVDEREEAEFRGNPALWKELGRYDRVRACCECCIRRRITERQFEIWRFRSEGKPFEEIAELLDCSVRTVYAEWLKAKKVASMCRRLFLKR